MYATKNFKTKKALKEAVAAGEVVTVQHPLIGQATIDGTTCLEGPWYPQPHTWYAEVTLVNGRVTKVR